MSNTYIPGGTRLTYVAEIHGKLVTAEQASGYISAMNSSLANNWNIIDEDSIITYPPTIAQYFSYTNGFIMKVLNNDDHGGMGTDGVEDVRSIIDGEFYKTFGFLPDASRITDYTLPENGGIINTGATPPPSNPNPAGKNIDDILAKLKDATNGLPSLGTVAWVAIIGVLALGALFVVVKA